VYGRGREWAYTRGLNRDENLHPADWNLFLLRECGLKIGEIKNQFQLPAHALAVAQKIFAENKLDAAKPTLFLQPFTSSPHKNWPLENYLAVARHWRTRGVQIVFGGGPGDLAALGPARAENFLVVAGVPLLVTGGLMELSTLVLGGDTGMLHLAIAQGKRAVMLVSDLAPGRPILFQHREWVVAAPDKRDLASIAIETVITETGKGLNPPAGNASY
jgi:ADP-heptose:LPS heptosyltransferase